MSGVASIAFLTIGLIYNITGSGQLRYWVIAAFVCFAIASFNAWYKIHPDLRIKQTGVTLVKELVRPYILSDGVVSFEPTLRLQITNTTPRENTIPKCQLSVYFGDGLAKIKSRAVRTKNGGLMGNLMVQGRIFKQGHVEQVWAKFQFPDTSADLRLDIRGLKYALNLRDAYGRNYRLWGKLPIDTDGVPYSPIVPVPFVDRLRCLVRHTRLSRFLLTVMGGFMSTDEEMAIIDRMVVERKQLEQRGAALGDEVRGIARGLESLALTLEVSDAFDGNDFLHLTTEQIELLDAAKVTALLSDIEETGKRYRELRTALQRAGR